MCKGPIVLYVGHCTVGYFYNDAGGGGLWAGGGRPSPWKTGGTSPPLDAGWKAHEF